MSSWPAASAHRGPIPNSVDACGSAVSAGLVADVQAPVADPGRRGRSHPPAPRPGRSGGAVAGSRDDPARPRTAGLPQRAARARGWWPCSSRSESYPRSRRRRRTSGDQRQYLLGGVPSWAGSTPPLRSTSSPLSSAKHHRRQRLRIGRRGDGPSAWASTRQSTSSVCQRRSESPTMRSTSASAPPSSDRALRHQAATPFGVGDDVGDDRADVVGRAARTRGRPAAAAAPTPDRCAPCSSRRGPARRASACRRRLRRGCPCPAPSRP